MIVSSVHQNIAARIASGSNEVFLLSGWGIRVEQGERVAVGLSEGEALPVLREGEVIGGRQIPWSSNYTFLVRLDAGPGLFVRAVYKPKAGERPLFDFPGGTLYKREQAAFVLGMAIGWPPVLLTTIREGPYGIGSMQLYVESDPRITYFDLIANNADLKGGHCVLGGDGRSGASTTA